MSGRTLSHAGAHLDRSRLPQAFDWLRDQGMKLVGSGAWRSTRCPIHNDRTPSLRVHADGGFCCLACGASGGDLVDFVRQRDGLSFVQAAQALGAWVAVPGQPPESSTARAAREAQAARTRHEAVSRAAAEQLREWARQAPRLAELWAGAHALLPGDAASLYLKRRDLFLARFPEALRYVPQLAYRHDDGSNSRHPAMLAAVLSPAGELVALHRTYLRADGTKASVPLPKKLTRTAGPVAGAAVRLGALRADGVLGVAEGIETALAAHLGSGVPVWAAVSAYGMASFVWPGAVRRLIVFADHDAGGTGERAADRLAQRARAAGLSVSVLMPRLPGDDWADVWAAMQRSGASA